LITDKNGKINKIILKYMSKILIIGFHVVNLLLIIFYLYPGSLLGLILYNNSSMQPQITRDFLISSNHFYAFIILSIAGIVAYNKSYKIYILIKYLLFISILLEFFHIIIPNRDFDLSDLFGNFLGVVIVIVFYKLKNKYV
jgi:VanZ family protein